MPAPKRRRITAEDLYRFQLISGCQISPDGDHVVFCQHRVDKETERKCSNLWVAGTNGECTRQFTYGDQIDKQPKWSPDGSEIAFISNRGNERQPQIYLISFNGGEARPLTNLKGEIGSFEWSPDGRWFVCTFRKEDREAIEREEDEQKKDLGVVARHITRLSFKENGVGYLPQERWHLWLIDTRTGQSKQLTDSEIYGESDPCWAPDVKKIVFRSNRSEDPDLDWDLIDLFVTPVTGCDLQRVETPPGLKELPSFSPDGKWVAYYERGTRHNRWRTTRLWVSPADGSGPARDLTERHDFDASHATRSDMGTMTAMPTTWSPDSQTIYFQVSHHGNTVLESISVEGSNLHEIIGDDGVVAEFSFDQAQSKLAYLHSTMTDPGQIWVRDVATGYSRRLTNVNEDLLQEIELGEVEEFWFKGAADNDLQGWILKPPGFDKTKKYPAILEIHGGPLEQYGNFFVHEFCFLAAHDYVVFFCNPRGGHGYGEAHARAIYNDWGGADYADLMAWTDFVKQKPYIDPDRMGVTGGSYGGHMTNWIIGHTDQFKAAVTQRGVSNMISMTGSSDLNWRFQALFGAEEPYWEDFENYWNQSPLKYIGNVRTPTLIIHSEQDLRCNIEQGEQVFVALKKLGVETEMVVFHDEAHGLSRAGRTDRRISRLNHMLRWFDRYLKG
jgi:dipeptidyl aminopeptidase/acylaminoacyl peptidase